MHVKAPMAAAIRSMCDPGAPQTQPDVIDRESMKNKIKTELDYYRDVHGMHPT